MQVEEYAYLYELEENYWWFAGMREITAALLDRVCPLDRNRLILDAGCGTGGMLSWLKRYAGKGHVVGIDLATTALEFSRLRGHQKLARASVQRLPFPEATFDLYTSFDVLYQLGGEGSDKSAITEMYRVLKPGGLAFVRVAAHEWMRSAHDETLGTQHRYSLPELVDKMEAAGFGIVRATYANSVLMPLAMFTRLVLRRIRPGPTGSDVRPLPSGLRWLNSAMSAILRAEALWLKRPGASLFMGLSAICVAQKPLAADSSQSL